MPTTEPQVPQNIPLAAPPLQDQVQAVLDRIRPAVQADGGDVELVDVLDNIARIRFHGACHGCPSSTMTLQHGIQRAIRDNVPAIQSVIPVA